jgi:hypothetical protein
MILGKQKITERKPPSWYSSNDDKTRTSNPSPNSTVTIYVINGCSVKALYTSYKWCVYIYMDIICY